MDDPGHGEYTDDDGQQETQELDERDVGFNMVGPVEGQNLERQEKEGVKVEHGKVANGYYVFIVLDFDLTIKNRKPEKKSKGPVPVKIGRAYLRNGRAGTSNNVVYVQKALHLTRVWEPFCWPWKTPPPGLVYHPLAVWNYLRRFYGNRTGFIRTPMKAGDRRCAGPLPGAAAEQAHYLRFKRPHSYVEWQRFRLELGRSLQGSKEVNAIQAIEQYELPNQPPASLNGWQWE